MLGRKFKTTTVYHVVQYNPMENFYFQLMKSLQPKARGLEGLYNSIPDNIPAGATHIERKDGFIVKEQGLQSRNLYYIPSCDT